MKPKAWPIQVMIIIMIITVFYIALFLLRSKHFTIITPVIGFRINSALRVHFLHSMGSIPASRHLTGAHTPTHHNTVRILPGPHLYTWVESSNVDKVSCWRIKVPGDSGNRTRALSVRVERSHHYTTNMQIHTERKSSGWNYDSWSSHSSHYLVKSKYFVVTVVNTWLWRLREFSLQNAK